MKLLLILVLFVLQDLTLSVQRQVQGRSCGDYIDFELESLIGINTSPCHVTTKEHDIIVNCDYKKLNHLESEWFPLNTTILNLEGNLLDSIPDGIFENCSQLQTLNLNNNKIKTIMPRAFLGLHKLENLDLGMNQLDICDKRFLKAAFEQLDNLKELDLLQKLPFINNEYCYDFIGNIVSLTSLSIDTQGKHVYFGEEFQNLTKLEKLIITGKAEIITDDSFKNLEKLRYLNLNSLESMKNISFNFLVPLVRLNQLYISKCYVGVEYTLNLLHPLVGRNMTTIYIEYVGLPAPWFANEKSLLDGKLDSNTTVILRKICVSDFSFIHSHLIYDALESETWNRCLQNIDLSRNPWQGNLQAFLMLSRLNNLRGFTVNDVIRINFEYMFLHSGFIPAFENRIPKNGFRWGKDKNEFSSKISESSFLPMSNVLNINNENTFNVDAQNISLDSTTIYFWVPRTLTYIDISRISNYGYFPHHLVLKDAENLSYIDVSYSGFKRFTGRIEGLSGLKNLKVSGNDMSITSEKFFDTFPALESLEVAKCGININFILTKGKRLLSSLKNLKRLDLSSNSLSMLAPDIFQSNKNLSDLNLSGNRFSEIPFSVTNTPKLKRLYICNNAITSLQPRVTDELDSLAHKWGKFELHLNGNILFCACQNIKFLQWLRLTAVTLDRNGNFTCINEQGVLTYTDSYIDLEGFWRQCWGQFFFYLSFILFSVMSIGFLCAFVINKYRTYVVSQLLGIFFGFRQHLPGDYKIGVFFAYEDLDYQFITRDLKRFVEQRLGMSIYIRHRDLDPGVVLGEAIAEAIASCWRTVIIINQDFQGSSEYFQFTCRSAVSMINLANPFRVLLLVTERYRHRIPRNILSAVQEDNIVVVKRLEIDGEMQQILRNRLTR